MISFLVTVTEPLFAAIVTWVSTENRGIRLFTPAMPRSSLDEFEWYWPRKL